MTIAESARILGENSHRGCSQWGFNRSWVYVEDRYDTLGPFEAVAIATAYLNGPSPSEVDSGIKVEFAAEISAEEKRMADWLADEPRRQREDRLRCYEIARAKGPE